MLKISRPEAYEGLTSDELAYIDKKLNKLFKAREDKEMTFSYYATELHVFFKVYYDDVEVASYTFKNRAGLTEQGKKRIGLD